MVNNKYNYAKKQRTFVTLNLKKNTAISLTTVRLMSNNQ